MNMNFGTNKRPVEVVKEGAFWGTYFRDIHSGINGKWYKKSWKEFDELKNIDQNYYCSNCYDVSVNKYKVRRGTSLRFGENKDWVNSLDSYGWFQWYFRYWLDSRLLDDERQIVRWKGVVSRFKDKLVKMIKVVNGRFHYYSIAP